MRDGTRLSFENGIKMLKIFKEAPNEHSIFEDFTYMDNREEKLRYSRELAQMWYKNMKQVMGVPEVKEEETIEENKDSDRNKGRRQFKGNHRQGNEAYGGNHHYNNRNNSRNNHYNHHHNRHGRRRYNNNNGNNNIGNNNKYKNNRTSGSGYNNEEIEEVKKEVENSDNLTQNIYEKKEQSEPKDTTPYVPKEQTTVIVNQIKLTKDPTPKLEEDQSAQILVKKKKKGSTNKKRRFKNKNKGRKDSNIVGEQESMYQKKSDYLEKIKEIKLNEANKKKNSNQKNRKKSKNDDSSEYVIKNKNVDVPIPESGGD